MGGAVLGGKTVPWLIWLPYVVTAILTIKHSNYGKLHIVTMATPQIKQDLEPQNLSRMIRETFTPVLVQETLLLILPMLAAGFLFIMYCVQVMSC